MMQMVGKGTLLQQRFCIQQTILLLEKRLAYSFFVLILGGSDEG
jgi:hypothetical protein